jgi:type I restriction enzyme S subunit
MNDEWVETTLDEVASVNPREPALSEDAPFITMADVDEWGVWATSSGGRGARSGARARAGDTLMARITPCLENGKIAMVPDSLERVGGSTEFIVLRAGEGVLPEFLFRWATSPDTHHSAVDLMVGTSGRKRVSGADIAKLPILLPPLGVQRRIVDLLEHLDTHLANLRAEREAAAAARESMLAWSLAGPDEANPFLGLESDWKKVDLGSICAIRSGFSFKSDEWTSEGNPVIQIGNVRDYNIVHPGLKFVGTESAEHAARYTLREGDIVVAMTGNVGSVARTSKDEAGFLVNQRVGLVVVSDAAQVTTDWLFYRVLACKPEMRGRSRQSIQANLSASDFHAIEVMLPSLAIQRSIVEVLDPMTASIDALDREIERLSLLRSGALSALLSREVEMPESYDELLSLEVAS